MAENKYKLLLQDVNHDKGTNKRHPWYKERLDTKYTKLRKKGDTSNILIGKEWTFLKKGVDDYRDGLPPVVEGSHFVKGSDILGPILKGSKDLDKKNRSVNFGRYNKDQICYTRTTPMQQKRKEYIEDVEYNLSLHPLALFPHLEECLPDDLFKEVVDLLDPELNMGYQEEPEEDLNSSENKPEEKLIIREDSTSSEENLSKVEDGKENERNFYRLPSKKEESESINKKKKKDKKGSSPTQEEHLQAIATDFCTWVRSLGGKDHNLEESTLMNLFAGGYESKPAFAVSVEPTEPSKLPLKFRETVDGYDISPEDLKIIPERANEDVNSAKKNKKRIKYGAWYLDPKSWHVKDESTLESDQNIEMIHKKTEDEGENLTDDSYAARAFLDFIHTKGRRVPKFLTHVEKMKAKEDEERIAESPSQLGKKSADQHRKLTSRLSGRDSKILLPPIG